MGWARFFFLVSIIGTLSLNCGRKDVKRSGAIKLRGERPVSLKHRDAGDFLQKGIASWYGHPFHGRKTSNGETYNMWDMTAAHKTIPFGTWVRVVNLENRREAWVRINDRGPFIRDRIIDLSRSAAEAIDMVNRGTVKVRLYLAENPDPTHPKSNAGPSQVSSPITSGFWTVQIASFQDLNRAVRLADALASTYADIQIERSNGYFRVRVGQFRQRRDAVGLAERLRESGYDPWVTQ